MWLSTSTHAIVILFWMVCPILAASAATDPSPAVLKQIGSALSKSLEWPVELRTRQDAKQRVLVVTLQSKEGKAAPSQPQDLFAPLFRVGRAAGKLPDFTHVEISSADAEEQPVTARVTLSAVQQLYDKKLSVEQFKTEVVYRVRTKEKSADELYREALATADNEGETELLRRTVAKDPQHMQAQVLLALKLFNGEAPGALQQLQLAKKLVPEAIEVSWFLASAYRTAQQTDQMLSEIAACEALANGTGESVIPKLGLPEARAQRMTTAWTKQHILSEVSQFRGAYLLDADRPEARAALEQHVKNWPDDATGQLLLGLYWTKRNDVGKALKLLETSVALNPRNYFAWRTLAALYQSRQKYNEEALAARRAMTLGDHQADNYVKLSYAYAKLDEWFDCKNAAAEGLKRYPDEASLRRNFKEAHKVIVAKSLRQSHPLFPLTAPIEAEDHSKR